MSTCSGSRAARTQAGLSLVELIISIVIISVGIAGILQVMNLTARHSADPLPRKQALAIAEALLEEVQLMSTTACDPDEYDMASGACGRADDIGPEPAMGGMKQTAAETRDSLAAPFDHVNDYHGLVLGAGARDLGNAASVSIPQGYEARIQVTREPALGPVTARPPQNAVLKISVSVSHGSESITLDAYRVRYAPDAMVLQ